MQAKNQLLLLTLLTTSLATSYSYADIALPERGTTQTQVQEKFGTPDSEQPTVGDPPITRWNYPTFSVVFEQERVIHAFKRNDAVENPTPASTASQLTIPVAAPAQDTTTTEETTDSSRPEPNEEPVEPAATTTEQTPATTEEPASSQETEQPATDKTDNTPITGTDYEVDTTYESDIPVN